jgi:hypothetical protein
MMPDDDKDKDTRERMVRVDASLAKQLGLALQDKARFHAAISRWLDAYPLTAFPEPDLKKAADVLKENGLTLDAISASTIRFTLRRVLDLLNDR